MHAAQIRHKIKVHKISVGKPGVEKSLGTPRRRWDLWWAFVEVKMNILVA
jgi:hypothetical protein